MSGPSASTTSGTSHRTSVVVLLSCHLAIAKFLEEIPNLIYLELCAFRDGPQRTRRNVLSRMDRDRGAAGGIVAMAHSHVTAHLPKLHKSGPLKSAYQANPVDLG